MFIIKTDDGDFISGISKELLFTTEQPEGTMKPDGSGYSNAALRFSTPSQAKKFIDRYQQIKMPRGYTHSVLSIVRAK